MPTGALRCGAQLLQPQYLTITPFLSGMTIAEASASQGRARRFVHDIKPVRGNTAKEVAAAFVKRKVQRAGAGRPQERKANPLVGLQSAPGGGKSAMLDTLGLLSSHGLWSDDLCPDAEMLSILNNSVPITVTYNSGADPRPGLYDADVETGFALRILHSFFINPSELSLSLFWSLFETGKSISVDIAIRTCLLAAEQQTGTRLGALLLVDEIAHMHKKNPSAAVPSLLGGMLDAFPSHELNVVCTTLDAVMVNKEFSESGREVLWASLPSITQASAEQLFLRALATHREPFAGAILPSAVRLVISDAAGHPRTLEYLLQAVLTTKDLKQTTVTELRDAAICHFPTPPTLAAVKAALCGKPLLLQEVPPGFTEPLSQLIMQGVFLNTDAFDQQPRSRRSKLDVARAVQEPWRADSGAASELSSAVIPKLSMLRLLQFAQCHRVESRCSQSQAIARCIYELAEVEACGVVDPVHPTLTGVYFERFVSHWLHLMCTVRDGEKLTALDLFHATELALFAPSSELTTPFEMTDSVRLLRPSSGNLQQAADAGELCNHEKGVIVQLGNNNPAFDVLMTLPVGVDGCVAALVETRSSDVGSRTEDAAADVEDKYKLLNFRSKAVPKRRGVRSILESMRPAPTLLYLVYFAARPMKNARAVQAAWCRKGVIVVCSATRGASSPSLATVQQTFTPSLGDRAFFLYRLQSDSPTPLL